MPLMYFQTDQLDKLHVQEIVAVIKKKIQLAIQEYDHKSPLCPKLVQICNNGCWVLAELAFKAPEVIKLNMEDILESLSILLNTGMF